MEEDHAMEAGERKEMDLQAGGGLRQPVHGKASRLQMYVNAEAGILYILLQLKFA